MLYDENNKLNRRDVIRGTGAITIASLLAPNAIEAATAPFGGTSASRDSAPLGQRIRGFQHFGMTVQNMDRAFEFYTEILGGTEIMRDGDFHGERIHNTLMLNDEIEAIAQKVNPVTIGVPDLRGGQQRLDVRFVQFDTWSWSYCTIVRAPSHRAPELPGRLRTTIEARRIQDRFISVSICGMTSTSTSSSMISRPSPCGVE